MPSTSAKQHRFMAAIANNPSFAKKVGVSQSVGKDFNAADKGKTFNKGGMMKTRKFATAGFVDDSDMDDEGNTRSKYEIDPDSRRAHGLYDEKPVVKKLARRIVSRAESKAIEDETKSNEARIASEKESAIQRGKNSVGEGARKFRSDFAKQTAQETNLRQAARAKQTQYSKGGMMKESKGMVGKEMAFMKKKGAPKSMIKHEKAEMMGMKKGGMPMKDGKPAFMAKFAKGGGIESRGKTKGTMIRMATGGSVSSASRRADGIAQRGKTRC